ncbi:NADPH-dependent 7-cyano-7-deazaguanine reductase QueF [Legionella geestiana]|uniref:NADPH-dependent 7-cyano-7-deazaguanine reductase QueF n=1 Tax=Legionella geestiana TaxID=45065 RepID=UPI001092985D|nr:NADPH-dependent 7-cyano-7-deazaguanine reductase QueF [Legionella geestiana]QDQ39309.1 NADPH-dependent 7-cyano-7-deazaguanine reductase QueF [Legionella geestiana]
MPDFSHPPVINAAEDSELGKKSLYESAYNPHKLFPIPRAGKRQEIGILSDKLPFYGFDRWNHYEVSWLNPKGKPMVGIAEIIYDCHTPCIIESKSLKLYFNSFNNTTIADAKTLEAIVREDLEARVQGPVSVKIHALSRFAERAMLAHFEGESIDALDVSCSVYQVEPAFLAAGLNTVEEVLCSDLLKSNCLVTHQPDWGSVQIAYKGPQIDREGLLKYLVSFREHNEFHEQCIERIFIDILNRCKPQVLTVTGFYTRRGGLDINPCRSTEPAFQPVDTLRLVRQ